MQNAVLLHGMLADKRVWRGVVPELSNLNCQLVELPGHGSAPDWDGGSFQTQALGLLEAAIPASAGPTHLIGHSFGATVALRFAVEHPERLRSLTLIEPVFFYAAKQAFPDEFRMYEDRSGKAMEALAAGDAYAAAEEFLGSWGLPGAWKNMPPAAQDSVASRMHLIDISAPSLVDDTGDIWARLDRVTCPVMLATGLLSEPVMTAIALALEMRMQVDAPFRFDDSGHMIPVTHGPILGQQIAQFTA